MGHPVVYLSWLTEMNDHLPQSRECTPPPSSRICEIHNAAKNVWSGEKSITLTAPDLGILGRWFSLEQRLGMRALISLQMNSSNVL